MKRSLALSLTLLLGSSYAPAQEPARTPPPQRQPAAQGNPSPVQASAEDADEEVVRVTSNLVQFDAVVTDRQGRPVTDLRPEELEVLVDGRRQEVSNLSFIPNEAGAVARGDDAVPTPDARLRSGQVRRAIALVVDDLGTSFESLSAVRGALAKFVDEQMQTGDLVAVMQTGRGLGALQQFTADKRLLHRAIERVRWNPLGRSGTSAFQPLTQAQPQQAAQEGSKGDDAEETAAQPGLERFRENVFTGGTLGALNFAIRGMKELPGRKSILLFSDGIRISDEKDPGGTHYLREKVRQLADVANRASVVIYTLDARGLPYTGLGAADSVAAGGDPSKITALLIERTRTYTGSQEGMQLLAEQTGGVFIHETNDLGGGMRRALDEQKGYYLIGFRPGERFFARAEGGVRFNRLEVKVRRPGLSVRTRAGFYGYAEGEVAPERRTRAEMFLAALASPVNSGEVPVRMTSLFSSPAAGAAAVDSLVHVDVSGFKFTDEPGGWKTAVVDLVALTLDEGGHVVDEVERTEAVRARGEMLDYVLANGLVYAVKVPVKKPGAYQVRVGVRDVTAGKIGTDSQFIEVADLKEGGLALSGIFATSAPGAESAAAPQQAAPPVGQRTTPLREATLRRFRQGSQADFNYQIYNARIERATGRPRLLTQVRLFRDGRVVFKGAVQPYDPGAQADMTRLAAGTRLSLSAQLPPGEYVLQVVVTDAPAGARPRTATQWIDFEIIK